MTDQSLLKKIEAAFPKWNVATDFVPPSMSDEEHDALRDLLYQLSPDSLPRAVGLVLYALVQNHDAINDISILEVTQFLNAYYDKDKWDAKRAEFSKLTGVSIGDLDRGNVQRGKAGNFGYFTREQCLVIVEWLESAKRWPVYRCSQEELADASRYWKEKAKSF